MTHEGTLRELRRGPQTNLDSSSLTAIDVDAADIKALFRRCQALEKLGKLDMALRDIQRCATIEPKNKTFLETLRRLRADIQAKVSAQTQRLTSRRPDKHSKDPGFTVCLQNIFRVSVVTRMTRMMHDITSMKGYDQCCISFLHSSRQHSPQTRGCRTCLKFFSMKKWKRTRKKKLVLTKNRVFLTILVDPVKFYIHDTTSGIYRLPTT